MSNNKIILKGCLDQYKKNNELTFSDDIIFELFSLTQITKPFDFSFEDIENSIADGGNDGGIDSIFILINDDNQKSLIDLEGFDFTQKTTLTLLVSQCKIENSFKESTLDKLITTLPELFNLEKSEDALLVRFNPILVEKALIAREAWKKTSTNGGNVKINFHYCCNAEHVEINGSFKSKIQQLTKNTEDHFIGADVNYNNYSSKELLKLYQTQKNKRLSLTFKETPLSTNYNKDGIGYVGTVLLKDYKSFITDDDKAIRDDLFENNIRHFQGLVDVNKKIKETIENPGKNDFWWLNNGITIIASNPTQVGKTLSIDNVQIVNGLQTSYSIFNNFKTEQDDNRSVLVKVIITENKVTIDNIIASTNRQNPVSPALLRATEEIQREIEIFFSNNGYYYDRRKNYYKNIGKSVTRIFSIQTTAQIIESILYNDPYTARAKPTSLIKEDNIYNKIFNSSDNYQIYLNCCLIYKKTNEFLGEIEDLSIKRKISNFKLHLLRIVSSLIIKKTDYTKSDMQNITLDNYTKEIFKDAVSILIDAIDDFKQANSDANLINMAKTKGLTTKLLKLLNKKK